MAKTAAAGERHEALRERLVDEAERVIRDGGHEGLRARALAEAVGCALGAIYTVFPDLHALILGVKARTLEALDGALAAAAEATGASAPEFGPAEARAMLLALGQAYLGFCSANYQLWRTLFQYHQPGGIPDWYQARLERLFRHLERPLAALMPRADRQARAVFARAIFSAVHGIISLGLDQKLGATPSALIAVEIEALTETLIAGLEARR